MDKVNSVDTVCKVDGEFYYCDTFDRNKDGVTANHFTYIGSGVIHSFNNVVYSNTLFSRKNFHFWRYNDRTLINA